MTFNLEAAGDEFAKINSRDQFFGFEKYCYRSSYYFGEVNELYIKMWLSSKGNASKEFKEEKKTPTKSSSPRSTKGRKPKKAASTVL